MHFESCWFFQEYCQIDWAAWVQAIGTIFAIVAAVFISKREHVKGVERAKQICSDKMILTRGIVKIAIDVNKTVLMEITPLNSQYIFIGNDGLNDLISQLEIAPLYEFNNASFATKVIKVVRNLKVISESIDEINNIKYLRNDLVKKIQDASSFIENLYSGMKTTDDFKKGNTYMENKYIFSMIGLLAIITGYIVYSFDGRYTFQHLDNKGVLVGDTRTGKAWICMDQITHNQMKSTKSYKEEFQKNFNGCFSFASPEH